MSDEDADYMSDKFLDNLVDLPPPSLVHNPPKKRQVDVKKKQNEDIKRQRKERHGSRTVHNEEQRNDRLQESLSHPIKADNKGFQMLAKMGYNPGTALGSNAVKSDALKEPIAITIKSGRSGLGRESALKELATKRAEIRRVHMLRAVGINNEAEVSTNAYRARVALKADERKLMHDLRRCQATCETLDQQAEIEIPEMAFFWAARDPPELEVDDAKKDADVKEDEVYVDDYNNAEKLELLTGYLRTAYFFCYWCGTRYENMQDLSDNCPGLARDDH